MTGRTNTTTRRCVICGGTAVRDTWPRTIAYKNRRVVINQPGWWCKDCNDAVLDSKDAAVADRAFAMLKA
jgi:YgiT-type zinc finger domain-containing protein